jgi:hypothetical protein
MPQPLLKLVVFRQQKSYSLLPWKQMQLSLNKTSMERKHMRTQRALCDTRKTVKYEVSRRKRLWGTGGTYPLILNLGHRYRWVISFMPRLLYPASTGRGGGGSQGRIRHGTTRKIPSRAETRTPVDQTSASVTVLSNFGSFLPEGRL